MFRSRTFTAANVRDASRLRGARRTFFFLVVVVLQVVAGFSPLAAGAALLPVTLIMLLLSARAGALAQRIGPRIPMTLGPLIVAAGAADARRHRARRQLPDRRPARRPGRSALGLSLVAVARSPPRRSAARRREHAGIASGVNNAVARAARLLAVAVVPALVGITGDGFYVPATMTRGFHLAMVVAAALSVLGGVLAWFTIRSDALRPEPERQDQYSCALAGPPPAAPAEPART